MTALDDNEMPDIKNHKLLALWAANCAGRVLLLFENARPEDERPRNAIKAARAWACGDLKVTKAREAAFASHAAARNTNDSSSRLAARAAGHAAATAHVAGHAQHAANYAIKAMSAASMMDFDETAISAERNWQYDQLPEHLQMLLFPSANR